MKDKIELIIKRNGRREQSFKSDNLTEIAKSFGAVMRKEGEKEGKKLRRMKI